MPIIPVLGSLRQEDCEFGAILCYTATLCFKKQGREKSLGEREKRDKN
jgi:hypothetical protein